ncbi:MAG: elongation factor Ts [Candidatus Improbicoccus pseudotrichonymphae]|uniref:Elongation factor Ts n=1 Tax=Candidatus Improbicoccus pseudotrichonymphae TaxID=3033792 RepID=A0AA48I4D5_9FIRM|nr:MAG: elongation factor Ts [Candidatus Improbicoccus pseudotrichonymphae]
MSFTSNDVKNLRQKTGCGIMDCKEALKFSDGNLEEAIVYLRKKGLASAKKRQSRATLEGLTFALSKENAGVIIEVNCETDFVATNKEFKDFVIMCAETIIDNNPKNIDELLLCKTSSGEIIDEVLKNKIMITGENIQINRFELLHGATQGYIHLDGKIAVLVSFLPKKNECCDECNEIVKNVAMHVAATDPLFLDKDSIPTETIESEKNIVKEQLSNSNKPRQILDKIIEGRLSKFYKDVCLLEQPYVKDASITVREYLDKNLKIEIKKFVRYARGKSN